MASDVEKSRSRDRHRRGDASARRTPTQRPTLLSESDESEGGADIPKEFKWLNKKAKARDAKQRALLKDITTRVEKVEDTVDEVQNVAAVFRERVSALENRTSVLESQGVRILKEDVSMESAQPGHDENELRVEVKGFLFDTPKDIIALMIGLR